MPLLAALALIGAMAVLGCAEEPEEGVGELLVRVTADGSPNYAFTTSELQANGEISHPEGATVTFGGWIWTRDGADSGITTQTVDPSNTTRGEVWQVSGIATVDGEPSDRAFSDEITIQNAPPLVSQPQLYPQSSPNVVCVDDDLVMVSTVVDPDGDPVTLSYLWTVNGVEVSTDPVLSSSFTAAFDNVGGTLTADDGFSSASTRVPSHFVSPQSNCPIPPPAAMVQPASSAPPAAATAPEVTSESVAQASSLAPLAAAAAADGVLSISESGLCEIEPDGRLTCTDGVAAPPDGLFARVRVSFDYACALTAGNGSIVCWGEPAEDFGQLDPPEGAFTALDLATETACALRATGEVACWGNASDGRTDAPEGAFVHLDVSETWSCAMDAAGVVTCWGVLE